MVPLAISRNALISLLPPILALVAGYLVYRDSIQKGRENGVAGLFGFIIAGLFLAGCARARCPCPRTGPSSTGVSDLYPYRSGLCSPARIPLFSVSRVLLVALRAGRLSAHLLGDGSIRSSVYSPTDRFDTQPVAPFGYGCDTSRAGDSPTRLLLGRQQWRPLSKVATHISIAARRPHPESCGLNAASVQLSPPSVDTSTVLIPRVPA